jgi:hypothetical protein
VTTPDNERDFLEALESVGGTTIRPPKPESNAVVETASADRPPTPTTVPSPPAHVTLKNIWRHPDAHPIALDLLLLRKYGHQWLEWEPETLQALIPEDFSTPTLSELNLSKIQACKTLHLVDTFWRQWEVFIACLMPFNNEFPDFEVMQVPTVAQLLVACDAAGHIRDDVTWSEEMKEYLKVVYVHDGIFLALPPANFAPLPAPPEEIDPGELVRRWYEVRSSGKAPTGETAVDEQLRRLLTADGYLEESRVRLQQQMNLHA